MDVRTKRVEGTKMIESKDIAMFTVRGDRRCWKGQARKYEYRGQKQET